jgi:Tol biopolymer transport system component
MMTPARIAAAAVFGALLAGGALLYAGSRPANNVPVMTPAPTATITPSAAARVDYRDLPGRILIEHLGNSLDGSEASSANSDKRRLYFMDAANMGPATVREFLPGQPATGKISADVSPDGKRVVFQDYAEKGRIWEANLDGTGLHELTSTCGCIDGDPAYDPTGTRIVLAHIEGTQSWLAIRDLATGTVTRLESTVGPSSDAIAEQPSWSPDGRRIVFSRLTWGGYPRPTSGRLSIVDVARDTVTDVNVPGELLPGEPDWAPDGSTIVFTSGPLGTTAGIADLGHRVMTVRPDGSGLTTLTIGNSAGAASWTPDGRHILYYDNNLMRLMNPDGSGQLPVDANGMDLSEQATGFGYIGHWVDAP